MRSPAGPPAHPAAVVLTLSHKTQYSLDEEVAFRHVRHYLGRWPIFVLIPESHAAVYPGLIPKRFPDRFFGSPSAHGSLLLSKAFYRAFLDYEFILIHHLDALVFADRLLDWCGAGYDFIGAPWLLSADTPQITEEKVGNGGFSLRRVQSFLRVLDSPRHFMDPDEYWLRYREGKGALTRWVNSPRRALKRLQTFNNIRWHIRWARKGDVHEDRFWAEYATHYDPTFRIAPVDVARRFAFEAEPRRSFERLGGQLPFGAHRWQRFDRGFYEPFLLQAGPGSAVERRPCAAANRDDLDQPLARIPDGAVEGTR